MLGSGRSGSLASSREGEEALILDAFAGWTVPGLLLLLVPRHPQRLPRSPN
jgi:3-deoxy-D-manno-octulosonic-acid transferase